MYVDLTDPGISQYLIGDQDWEPISSDTYESEIRRLSRTHESPVMVLDIGANIGYYTLLAAAVSNKVRVLAAEVQQPNLELLKKNVAVNGFDDRVQIAHCAVGPETGATQTFYVSRKSNRSSLVKDPDEDYIAKYQVETKSVQDLLLEYQVDPEDLDVLRMDLDGLEAALIPAIEASIGFASIALVAIEVHPNKMSKSEVDEIIAIFDNHDFEVVAAARNEQRLEITEWSDIHRFEWIELVLAQA